MIETDKQREELQQRINVMVAYNDKKIIQYIDPNDSDDEWSDCEKPLWNWSRMDYRIKPEFFGAVDLGKYSNCGTGGGSCGGSSFVITTCFCDPAHDAQSVHMLQEQQKKQQEQLAKESEIKKSSIIIRSREYFIDKEREEKEEIARLNLIYKDVPFTWVKEGPTEKDILWNFEKKSEFGVTLWRVTSYAAYANTEFFSWLELVEKRWLYTSDKKEWGIFE